MGNSDDQGQHPQPPLTFFVEDRLHLPDLVMGDEYGRSEYRIPVTPIPAAHLNDPTTPGEVIWPPVEPECGAHA